MLEVLKSSVALWPPSGYDWKSEIQRWVEMEADCLSWPEKMIAWSELRRDRGSASATTSPSPGEASVVASPSSDAVAELRVPAVPSSPGATNLMYFLPVYPASPTLHSERPGVRLSCHRVPGAHAGLVCRRCSVNICAKNERWRCSACGLWALWAGLPT